MPQPAQPSPTYPQGKHRYQSVVEGFELANAFARSRLTISQFARQQGVSFRMVKYWSTRARQLASASSSDLVQVAQVGADGAIEVTAQPASSSTPALLPAPAPPAASTPPVIEVRLPNGVRIGIGAGFSAEMLTQVIACVGRNASC